MARIEFTSGQDLIVKMIHMFTLFAIFCLTLQIPRLICKIWDLMFDNNIVLLVLYFSTVMIWMGIYNVPQKLDNEIRWEISYRK